MPLFLQTNSLTGCTVPASRASAIQLHSVPRSRLTGVCGMSMVLLDGSSSIGVGCSLLPPEGEAGHTINHETLEQISHFFEHYKDLERGKWVRIRGWADVDTAKQEITESVARFREAMQA